jgi:hypothetical protein
MTSEHVPREPEHIAVGDSRDPVQSRDRKRVGVLKFSSQHRREGIPGAPEPDEHSRGGRRSSHNGAAPTPSWSGPSSDSSTSDVLLEIRPPAVSEMTGDLAYPHAPKLTVNTALCMS